MQKGRRIRLAENQRHQKGAEDPQHGPGGGADQPLQADPLQPDFKEDDAAAQNQAAHRRNLPRQAKRVQQIGGSGENQDENSANNE